MPRQSPLATRWRFPWPRARAPRALGALPRSPHGDSCGTAAPIARPRGSWGARAPDGRASVKRAASGSARPRGRPTLRGLCCSWPRSALGDTRRRTDGVTWAAPLPPNEVCPARPSSCGRGDGASGVPLRAPGGCEPGRLVTVARLRPSRDDASGTEEGRIPRPGCFQTGFSVRCREGGARARRVRVCVRSTPCRAAISS